MSADVFLDGKKIGRVADFKIPFPAILGSLSIAWGANGIFTADAAAPGYHFGMIVRRISRDREAMVVAAPEADDRLCVVEADGVKSHWPISDIEMVP